MPADAHRSGYSGTESPLALSRQGHDRAGARRTDTAWLADQWPTAHVLPMTTQGFAAVSGTDLVSVTGAEAEALPGVVDADWPSRIFLGEAGDQAWFAVVLDPQSPAPGGGAWANLRDVGARIGELEAGLFTSATALIAWHARNPFCPQCGATTVPENAGWHRRCTAQGTELFPRTDPAVIMLVHDGGDRCVLGRQAVWPPGRFSVLAGFVEAGEPFEAAVVREVAEEVGLDVTDVRYVASQPWPFPQSLMIGCTARAVTTELASRDDEIAEAYWFTRAEVEQAVTWEQQLEFERVGDHEPAGVGPGGALRALPGPVSIARQLLDAWVAHRL